MTRTSTPGLFLERMQRCFLKPARKFCSIRFFRKSMPVSRSPSTSSKRITQSSFALSTVLLSDIIFAWFGMAKIRPVACLIAGRSTKMASVSDASTWCKWSIKKKNVSSFPQTVDKVYKNILSIVFYFSKICSKIKVS